MALEDKMLPVKPILFDKKRLSTPEFKNYIYEIVFKKSGLKVRDMNLAGYIHAISPYLKGIQSEVVNYGFVGEQRILRVTVRSTITVSFKSSEHSTGVTNDMTFTALADGDVTNAPSSDTLVRTVETRALKRAIARALDISKADLNENFVEEDEIGTPLNMNGIDEAAEKENPHKKSPQDISREKERKISDANAEAELDEELDKAAQDPHSGSTDSDW